MTAILSILASLSLAAGTAPSPPASHTFYLEGGYFYGPGPVVPDTDLPHGRLVNIRFDARQLRGYCEFANDGSSASVLSDQRTRINQNIDAGRLLIGGGTSPVMLTAVDGGPHHGTEQYYLDEEYRFVWRVDIALDPGFAEGIIRLDDFVLNTGVVRIGRSLQSQAGLPGGYDQAGSLRAGEFLAGRVGDFDEDNFLDGVLVAAPNVPLAADMLPGAPVGNRRGFRTDVPIAPHLSAELMLRGAMHLREAVGITLSEPNSPAAAHLLQDLEQRIRTSQSRLSSAPDGSAWRRSTTPAQAARLMKQLDRLHADAAAMARQGALPQPAQADRLFARLQSIIADLALLNARSGESLPEPGRSAVFRHDTGPVQKSY